MLPQNLTQTQTLGRPNEILWPDHGQPRVFKSVAKHTKHFNYSSGIPLKGPESFSFSHIVYYLTYVDVEPRKMVQKNIFVGQE